MKHAIRIFFAASLAASASAAAAGGYRWLNSWDRTNLQIPTLAEPWVKAIETASNGTIKINVSGPEAVPPFDQMQPVSAGAFQFLFTHGAYHFGTTPMLATIEAMGAGRKAARSIKRYLRIRDFGKGAADDKAPLPDQPEPAALAAPVDYAREIQPLLAQHCYQCHGAMQPKHGLRLDTAASALKGGQSGPAFTPGKASASLLVQVISGTHKDITRMPYKKPPLSDAQIALVRRWIDEGAKAPANEVPGSKMHWAFVAPQRPEVPRVISKEVTSNSPGKAAKFAPLNTQSLIANYSHPIDAFIRRRLAAEGLAPRPAAAPAANWL